VIEKYKQNLEKIGIIGKSDLNVVFCQHAPPETPKLYLSLLKTPSIVLKYFFWGHKHVIKPDFIEKLKALGPIECVMPEANQFKLQIWEV
jgi:hypothetical protein